MATAPPVKDRAAARLARAERRTRAVKLSVAGRTYDQIAAELGYGSKQAAHKDVKAALAEALAKQNLAVEEWRAKELALLDEALQVAHRIMNSEHLAHSAGRLIRREVEREDGTISYVDVVDNGPNLAAADRLIKISESRRKLLGVDAPARVESTVDGTINYVINAEPGELDQL